MIVREAQASEVEVIRDIAWQTWPIAYADVISEEQIEYMLNKMYNHDLLAEQFTRPEFCFLLAETDEPIGFCVAEYHFPEPRFCRIHKLYVLPHIQKSGAGKALIEGIGRIAKKNGMSALHLNVNRFNPSVAFYEKMNFQIAYEEDIDIGSGFLMEDYVMILEL